MQISAVFCQSAGQPTERPVSARFGDGAPAGRANQLQPEIEQAEIKQAEIEQAKIERAKIERLARGFARGSATS
jgi:hypothetical protein